MIFENRRRYCRTGNVLMLLAFTFPLLTFFGNAYAVDVSQEHFPFRTFFSGIKNARFEDYAKNEGVKVSSAVEFEKMKAHVVSIYEGVKIKNSFMLDGDYIDCVDINTQPGLRQNGKFLPLAKPPKPMIAREEKPSDESQQSQAVEPMLSKEKKDANGNVQYCEEGFIPMRRMTLDGLVRYKTLSDFLNKYGNAGEKGLPIRK